MTLVPLSLQRDRRTTGVGVIEPALGAGNQIEPRVISRVIQDAAALSQLTGFAGGQERGRQGAGGMVGMLLLAFAGAREQDMFRFGWVRRRGVYIMLVGILIVAVILHGLLLPVLSAVAVAGMGGTFGADVA